MRRATCAGLLAAVAACSLTQSSDGAVYLNSAFESTPVSFGTVAFDVTVDTWVRNFTPTAGTISMTLKRTPTGGTAANYGALSLICSSSDPSDPGKIAGNYFRMVWPATTASYSYSNYNLFTFASTATTDDVAISGKVSGTGNWELRNDLGRMVARVTLGKDASDNMTVSVGGATPVSTTSLSAGWSDLLIQTNKAGNTFTASINGTVIGSSAFVTGESLAGGFRQLQLVPASGGRMYTDELMVQTAVVPEPAVGGLVALGLGAFALRRRHG